MGTEIIVSIASSLSNEFGGIIGAFCGGFIIFLFNILYRKVMKKRYYTRQNSVPDLVYTDLSIYQYLTELLLLTKADRAYVMQFHNGVFYLALNSQMKLSCTHEIVKPGISREQAGLQNLLISSMSTEINALIKHDVVKFTNKENTNTYFNRFLESHGITTSIAAVMRKENLIVGLVFIDYTDNDDIPMGNTAEPYNTLKDIAGKISFSLENKKRDKHGNFKK